MSWHEFTDPTFSSRLCLTLLHSIWQVAIVALLARGLDRFVSSGTNARTSCTTASRPMGSWRRLMSCRGELRFGWPKLSSAPSPGR